MKIPTKYSSIEELHLDMAILGKILQVPSQTIEEMRETLYKEYERLHPKVTLEDKRYELSRQVSDDYDISYESDLELGVSEHLVDLSENRVNTFTYDDEDVVVSEETKVLFRYENQVQDDSLEAFLGGDTHMFNGDLSMIGTTKHREDLVLSDEEINRMSATTETWGQDGLEVDDSIYTDALNSSSEDEVTFHAEDGNTGYDFVKPVKNFENKYESWYSEYNLDLEDSDEPAEYIEEVEESKQGVDFGSFALDLDDSDEDAEYYEEADEQTGYNGYDLDLADSDEDAEYYDSDEDGYDSEDNEYETLSSSDYSEYGLDLDDSIEDAEYYDEADEEDTEYYESDEDDEYTSDDEEYDEYTSDDEEEYDEYASDVEEYDEYASEDDEYTFEDDEYDEYTSEEDKDFDSYLEDDETTEDEQSIDDVQMTVDEVDSDAEDLGFVDEPTQPMYNTYMPNIKDDFGSQPIHEEKPKVVPQETVTIEIPKDIRSFVRMNPRCTTQEVLKHYSKKQLEQEIMMGKIIRKGNILHLV